MAVWPDGYELSVRPLDNGALSNQGIGSGGASAALARVAAASSPGDTATPLCDLIVAPRLPTDGEHALRRFDGLVEERRAKFRTRLRAFVMRRHEVII